MPAAAPGPDAAVRGDDARAAIDPDARETTREIAVRAIEELEIVKADSKLDALAALLREIVNARTPATRVCVITDFVATYYLAAELEGRELSSSFLHGAMPNETRRESLTTFRDEGDVLVATSAAMIEGVSLPEVTDLVSTTCR
jgi:superfamily II DNA/RNA helicase